ncbi:unnamed protein product [Effrenium voratum]|uniref:PKD/REJ-like domain-containing protein n=1 Tax=Effrenium voratum TaxID=2562239 RepID=A0AA36IRR6_9DINO|nr:unnamed protein product [Effrenium voratum]
MHAIGQLVLWTLTLTAWATSLSLDKVEFTHGFTTLLLRFSTEAEMADNSGDFTCESILSASSLATMGRLPSCRWLQSGAVLEVLLGDQPSLSVNDTVATLPSVLVATAASADPPAPELSGLVEGGSATAPEAILMAWPPVAAPCTTVHLSAAQSRGAYGRPLTAQWRLTAPNTAPALEAILNASSALTVELPATAVSDWSGSGNASVEVVVTVTNWLGLSHSATAPLSVNSAAQPPVYPSTVTEKAIALSGSTTFSVATRYADPSACGAASNLPSETAAVTWDYRTANSSEWLPLNASERVPWRAPVSGSLGVGAWQLRASADTAGTQGFQLTVRERLPQVAVIHGPNVAPESCGFTLDASTSFDELGAELFFYWSCAGEGVNGTCRRLPNFGPGQWVHTDGTGSLGKIFQVAPGTLAEGNYTFTLQLVRSEDQTSVFAEWFVAVRSSTVPITVFSGWTANQSISNQAGAEELPRVWGKVWPGPGCGGRESAQWTWALVEEETSSILTNISSSVSAGAMGELDVEAASDFPLNFLLPGQRYTMVLMQMGPTLPKTLAEAEALGLAFASSAAFAADAAPAGGRVLAAAVAAASGGEVFVSTEGWYDEDMANLSYFFYRFPSQGLSLVDDGNGGVEVNGTFPVVEWRDADSASHWSKQGSFLGFSELPFLSLALSPGRHLLAVVAQDSLGAVASAFALGPLISTPSASNVQSALDLSVLSNNANIILNTLGASIFALGDLDTGKEVYALTAAAATLELSDLGLRQMSSIATDLLRNRTAATAEQISQVAAQVFADLVQSPSPAAAHLLDVVYAVRAVYAAETDQVVQRSEQLTLLAQQFGQAVAAFVPLHGEVLLEATQSPGLQVFVHKEGYPHALLKGLSAGGFSVSSWELNALSDRRLAQASCSTIDVQLTTWLNSNPYDWANQSSYASLYVKPDATVTVVDLRRCSAAVNLTARAVKLRLPLPPAPTEAPPEGWFWQAACATFDFAELNWDSSRLTFVELPEAMECTKPSVEDANVVFTIFYRPRRLPPEDKELSMGASLVLILIFLLCLGAMAYANGRKGKDSQVSPTDSEASRAVVAPEEPSGSAGPAGSAAPGASGRPAEGKAAEAAAEERPAGADGEAAGGKETAAAGSMSPVLAEGPRAAARVPEPDTSAGEPLDVKVDPAFKDFAQDFASPAAEPAEPAAGPAASGASGASAAASAETPEAPPTDTTQ